MTCSCGDPTRKHINHRKLIQCWTYIGTERYSVDRAGSVVRSPQQVERLRAQLERRPL